MLILLLTVLVLAVLVPLLAVTWHAVRLDRPSAAPTSRRADPDFLPPAQRLLGH